MAYPELLFEAETGKVKPSVLVVADSFFWGMFNFGISRSFSKTDFWFYNRQIFETPTGKPLSTGEVNFQEQILGHDVIILMATEANLPQFGWGFIDQAWKALKRLEAAETASR